MIQLLADSKAEAFVQSNACDYRKPNQVAPASTKVICRFHQSIQAYVMWIKNQNKFPLLSIVDEGTRFQVAVLINAEKSENYITALDRHWIAPLGIPQCLITGEGRGWLHDSFGEWTDAQSIQHLVAAGEAHEQLALVESSMQFCARPLKFSWRTLDVQKIWHKLKPSLFLDLWTRFHLHFRNLLQHHLPILVDLDL